MSLPETNRVERAKCSEWKAIEKSVSVGDEYSGTVTGYYHLDSDAPMMFVLVEAGPLLFALAARVRPPLPKLGEEVSVRIIRINQERKQIFGRYLGLAKPWSELTENLAVGDVIGGVVIGHHRNLTFVRAMPEGYVVAVPCNGGTMPARGRYMAVSVKRVDRERRRVFGAFWSPRATEKNKEKNNTVGGEKIDD
jgi:exosome complex RNA-binding protein Csl4